MKIAFVEMKEGWERDFVKKKLRGVVFYSCPYACKGKPLRVFMLINSLLFIKGSKL